MEYINELYEYVYDNIPENWNYNFYEYFQTTKSDIFKDINFNQINIYTAVDILNKRKQNINYYYLPKDFNVSDKLSVLKYKLSFCLLTNKDMTDHMLNYIEIYKNNIDIKNEMEIKKVINDAIEEIKKEKDIEKENDVEMIKLEDRYNKLKEEIFADDIKNRLNKLKEEIQQDDDEDDHDANNTAPIKIKCDT